MNWLEAIAVIGGVVTVFAGIAGIALTIDQLTQSARLRRTESWARELQQMDLNPAQSMLIKNIHLRVSARLVSAALISPKNIVVMLIGGLLTVVLMAYSVWRSMGAEIVVSLILASFVWNAINARHGILVYRRRLTVERIYKGNDLNHKEALAAWGKISKDNFGMKDYVIPAILATAICLIGFGIGGFLAGISDSGFNYWMAMLVYGGLGAIGVIRQRIDKP